MKHLLLFTLLTISLYSQGQGPMLTNTSAPAIGDSYIFQAVYMAGIVPGAAGANQVWDYSTAVDSAASYSEIVIDPATTPYASSFPGANIALTTPGSTDTAYGYEDLTAGSLSYLGNYIGAAGTIVYTTPRVLFQYPLAYGDSYVNSFAGSTNNGDTVTGIDSFMADGYGTLKLPGHTYNNVLRVKYIQHTHTINSGFGYYEDLYQLEYSYYIPGYHNFLFDMEFTINNINGTSYPGTAAQYSKAVSTGIPDISSAQNIKVYPRLVSDELHISMTDDQGMGKYEIYDLAGGRVMAGDLYADVINAINISGLPSSLYLIKIIDASNSHTYKIVKK